MKHISIVWFVPAFALLLPGLQAWEYTALSEEHRSVLESGEAVIFSSRPDDGAEPDQRFVTAGRLIAGSRDLIWEVLNDKEDAEDFVDGILDSEVLEEEENVLTVKQRTHVGGPKGAYTYTLRYVLTPKSKTEFFYLGGEIKNVTGAWWIFDGPDESTFLVVYALHIDPGVFAPRFVIKQGQKKSMTGTLISMERELKRRQVESKSE